MWRIFDSLLLIMYGIMATWMLITLIGGANRVHEDNKVILFTEIAIYSGLTLYGIIRYIQSVKKEVAK